MAHPASSLGSAGMTVPINDSGSATVTLKAADTSRRWQIFYIHIEADADTTLTFQSGATALSGGLFVDASAAGAPMPLIIDGHGHPVLIGDAVGDALTVANSASADLQGFAVVMGVETQ